MKAYAGELGYKAEGYKAFDIRDLKSAAKPCIVPVSIYGYYHFVVVKGLNNGRVFIADPFKGNISFTEHEFKPLWFKNFIFGVNIDGSSTMNRLVVTNEDLRMIDEEMAKSYLLQFRDKYRLPNEQGVSDKLIYRH